MKYQWRAKGMILGLNKAIIRTKVSAKKYKPWQIFLPLELQQRKSACRPRKVPESVLRIEAGGMKI